MVVRFFILLVSLSIAYSCNTTQETTSQNDPVIFAGTFVVNTLYDQPIEGDDLNLKINDRTSKISGFSGCNTYSVAFTKSNNTITFSPAIGTKIFCYENAMKKERQFLNIFASPKEFSIKKDTLILYDGGKEVLKATRFIF
ncbi:MAG: heat shock protein HslJ [Dokdonia sp.]|jgi:heat shock protein HslJ